jgi:hypothetical protein
LARRHRRIILGDHVAAFAEKQLSAVGASRGRNSGNAAVSHEDPRRPLSASRLQTRRGPLASAGDEQGALGPGGSALLIAEG